MFGGSVTVALQLELEASESLLLSNTVQGRSIRVFKFRASPLALTNHCDRFIICKINPRVSEMFSSPSHPIRKLMLRENSPIPEALHIRSSNVKQGKGDEISQS